MSTVSAEAQGRRAGVVTRGVAFTIDFFCVLAAYPLALWGIGIVDGLLNFTTPRYPELPNGWDAAIQLVIMFWYFVGPWAINGRTIGQALLGLRVVSRNRVRVRLWQAAWRWWVLFLTLLWIGPLWLLFSRRRLALHDIAARTQVVYDRAPKRTAVRVALGAAGAHAGSVEAAAAPGPPTP